MEEAKIKNWYLYDWTKEDVNKDVNKKLSLSILRSSSSSGKCIVHIKDYNTYEPNCDKNIVNKNCDALKLLWHLSSEGHAVHNDNPN